MVNLGLLGAVEILGYFEKVILSCENKLFLRVFCHGYGGKGMLKPIMIFKFQQCVQFFSNYD